MLREHRAVLDNQGSGRRRRLTRPTVTAHCWERAPEDHQPIETHKLAGRAGGFSDTH